MIGSQPRYSKEEHARRGADLYEQLRPKVEAGNLGRIVALDVDTGTYEVAEDTLTASQRLLARFPDADLVCPHRLSGGPSLRPSYSRRGDMMTGIVNTDLEALLRVRVQEATGQFLEVEAVIDTGFNGFLTLPRALIASLGLSWLCRQQGQLADGSVQAFDVYVATVDWDGHSRSVEVEAVDTQPLVGMALLQGSELRIRVLSGGSVMIERLS